MTKMATKAAGKMDGIADFLSEQVIGRLLDMLPPRYKTVVGGCLFGAAIIANELITHFAMFTNTTVDEIVVQIALYSGGSLAGLGLMHKQRKTPTMTTIGSNGRAS